MNCQLSSVVKNFNLSYGSHVWHTTSHVIRGTRIGCGRCGVFDSLPSTIRRFHSSVSQSIRPCIRTRVNQASRPPYRLFSQTLHQNFSSSVGRGSIRWGRCRELFNKHRPSNGRTDSVRIYCSKAGDGKTGSIPPVSEIRRLLSLAKPEKWRLAGPEHTHICDLKEALEPLFTIRLCDITESQGLLFTISLCDHTESQGLYLPSLHQPL